MDEVLAGPVLAANEVSGGTAGALIVVFLCVAAALVFYFMFGSLKRLRRNVDEGQFGAAPTAGDEAGREATAKQADADKAEAVVVPRQADGSADAERGA